MDVQIEEDDPLLALEDLTLEVELKANLVDAVEDVKQPKKEEHPVND